MRGTTMAALTIGVGLAVSGCASDAGYGDERALPATSARPSATPSATATPQFLTAAELPSKQGPWHAGEVTAGLPDPTYACLADALPAADSSSRTFTGDLAAEFRETVVVTADQDAAMALVQRVATAISGCADRVEGNNTSADYSLPDKLRGLRVIGVYFAPKDSEYHFQLYGVGHAGNLVVVTSLSDMGRATEAPRDQFRFTADKAIATTS